MSSLLGDLTYGLRVLARKPGFAAAALLTLALGIGANEAIFSVVDSVLFRPLPFSNAERLLVLCEENPSVAGFCIASPPSVEGIRMALGANERSIIRSVVARGMAPALVGVVLGLSAAFGVTRVLVSLLVGVQPTDPLTFAAIAAILMIVAAAACYVPAQRATRVNAVDSLRSE